MPMAGEIFAKLGDIQGESTDAHHKGEIEVLSYTWGVAHPVAAGGAVTGRATFHELFFSHPIDKASPKIMEACALNRRLPEARITHRRPGGAQPEYLTLKLTNVVVTSVSLSDTASGGIENVTLAFAQVDFEYKPQRPDGSLDPAVVFQFNTVTHA
jgi:type VI secretion system secreted protein Hcp